MVGCRSLRERCVHRSSEERQQRWFVLFTAPYTNKSDVWSYGVTAWEVFAKAEIPYSHVTQNHLVINAVKAGTEGHVC
jgi:hypothetical protein